MLKSRSKSRKTFQAIELQFLKQFHRLTVKKVGQVATAENFQLPESLFHYKMYSNGKTARDFYLSALQYVKYALPGVTDGYLQPPRASFNHHNLKTSKSSV